MDFVEIVAGGHVVADIVVRSGKDNLEFGSFRLAVNQFAGTQESVGYYDCTVPNSTLQGMQKAGVKKGSSIMVAGAQTLRIYKGNDGFDKMSVNVRVHEWKYIGGRAKHENQSSAKTETDQKAANKTNTASQQQRGNVQAPVNLQDEDDLPV